MCPIDIYLSHLGEMDSYTLISKFCISNKHLPLIQLFHVWLQSDTNIF